MSPENCAYCDGPCERVFRLWPLPWSFCSEPCRREYLNKDGEVPDADAPSLPISNTTNESNG